MHVGSGNDGDDGDNESDVGGYGGDEDEDDDGGDNDSMLWAIFCLCCRQPRYQIRPIQITPHYFTAC